MQIKWTEDKAKEFLSSYIQFDNFKSKYQRKLQGKNELLVKAIGSADHRVCDLTAGLGEDAWTLARLGYHVTAIEKDPFLFECLSQAHARALSNPLSKETAERVQFYHMDSIEFLKQTQNHYPVYYLDPMFDFPEQPSTLPRKEMQAMRALFHSKAQVQSALNDELLMAALHGAKLRVVMKNAKKINLLGPAPSFQVQGRAIRFDIYLVNGGKK